MVDPNIKRSLGQMIKGVQVLAANHDGLTRAYTSSLGLPDLIRYAAPEYVEADEEGRPILPNSIAWLHCETFDRIERFDHDLFLANVTAVTEGRLG